MVLLWRRSLWSYIYFTSNWEIMQVFLIQKWEKYHRNVIEYLTKYHGCAGIFFIAIWTGLEPATSTVTG
jgi:hypothetical protein